MRLHCNGDLEFHDRLLHDHRSPVESTAYPGNLSAMSKLDTGDIWKWWAISARVINSHDRTSSQV